MLLPPVIVLVNDSGNALGRIGLCTLPVYFLLLFNKMGPPNSRMSKPAALKKKKALASLQKKSLSLVKREQQVY